MEPRYYRITVRGRLSERFASALGPMQAEPGDGQTVLAGWLTDSTQLYGVLDRLRDFGIDLLRLESAVGRSLDLAAGGKPEGAGKEGR